MRYALFSLLFSATGTAQEMPQYLSTSKITYSIGRHYEPETDLEKYFQEHFPATLRGKANRFRARAVFDHMTKLKFGPERHDKLTDFINQGSGNCYAHSRLALFLLRKLTVPAKPMYEIHLEPVSERRKASAKEAKSNIFGLAHNDHLSVLFFDGQKWQPFDSAMRVFGSEKFRKRFPKKEIEIWAEGKAHQLAVGAPFVIWSVTKEGHSTNAISDLFSDSELSALQKDFRTIQSPSEFESRFTPETEKNLASSSQKILGVEE